MKMKNRWIALLVIGFVMLLGACSGEAGERTFKLEEEGITSMVTYEHEGDEVIKHTTEVTMDYSALGLSSKEEAEEFFEAMGSSEKIDIEGVSHDITYKNDTLSETLTIDFTEADVEDLKEIPGFGDDEDLENGISLKESIKLIESQGYEEVE